MERPSSVPTGGPGGRGAQRRVRGGWARCDPGCVCSAAGTRRNLRNDLLVAADSITNTMSSLVKELHSGRT